MMCALLFIAALVKALGRLLLQLFQSCNTAAEPHNCSAFGVSPTTDTEAVITRALSAEDVILVHAWESYFCGCDNLLQVPAKLVMSTARRVFCCELDGYGDVDPCGMHCMLTGLGFTSLPFHLSAAQDTADKRWAHPKWIDALHSVGQVVAYSIVAPMVRRILADCNYVSGAAFSIAIIGDSTTAYCSDLARPPMASTRREVSTLIKEAVGNDDLYIRLFSSSGSSFSKKWDFHKQMNEVISSESRDWGYDAIVLIGGWNSVAEETSEASQLTIRKQFNYWIMK